MKHAIRMLIGCALPFLLIFLLPLVGISEGATLLLFIVLMFACHLLMIGGHRHGPQVEHDHNHDEKGENHARS